MIVTPHLTNIPSVTTAAEWRTIAKESHNEAIEQRMNDFIASKAEDCALDVDIAILPREIAFIMGEQEIVKIFDLYYAKTLAANARQTIYQMPAESDTNSSSPSTKL